uniref:Uncharacterized protein n=1 Tax=Chrysotila carterae TaxID=13221 RepID=A0A7S4C0F7_CHRCT|mmetsp:Transcript_35797/g.75227  ORF Transcript_35797/g.75227 Transcript_35797/m.75227 type:complete len:101 (+) Transcript_35797:999-1301(+)
MKEGRFTQASQARARARRRHAGIPPRRDAQRPHKDTYGPQKAEAGPPPTVEQHAHWTPDSSWGGEVECESGKEADGEDASGRASASASTGQRVSMCAAGQ